MKRIIFISIFFSFVFFSCTKNTTRNQEVNVFIGGFRQELRNNRLISYAKYWKNGVSKDVTDGSRFVFVYDMAVKNNDIYFAGHERPITGGPTMAMYWKNGAGFALDTLQSDATTIAVTGQDVYVGGYDNNQSMVWKNGATTSFRYGVNALYASSDDIYIAGFSSYWKNDVMTTINDPSAIFKSITISGENIYCAGSTGNAPVSAGISSIPTAAYWINGKPYYVGRGQINSITSSWGDIYMVGYLYQGVSLSGTSGLGKVATFWKNGIATRLMDNAEARGITIDNNNNVHIIGNDNSGLPLYWKNGMVTEVPGADSTDIFMTVRAN